ncbi:MAG: hypothetical protein K6C96_08255 [Butyrivibrio sp.]|nr:hypothetical protein [Butyrivibrio sp.]
MKKVKKVIRKTYSEVKLPDAAQFERNYKNPLTGQFQYEYALFLAVSDLFSSVSCQSMCIESLKLYFLELPAKAQKAETENGESSSAEKKRKTRESILAETTMMVSRDVVSNITFPQINICRAKALVLTEKDGTHTFLFHDGIYGFTVHMEAPQKGKPRCILVKDLST